MIIATAGHVDHGKTSLVQALTGIDTDSLAQEKARGLTIDLGFAYIHKGEETIGFVDVPGHLKFISNMLAGVSGIDFGLLVIAADDGPMPQTIEHLAILSLLGLDQGAIAITKCDRVTHERLEQLENEIDNLTQHTPFTDVPRFNLSSITGAGIEELQDHLWRVEASTRESLASKQTESHFRLAVDRAFSVKGSGLVVTGSIFSGQVNEADDLYLQPQGKKVKVRGIHRQNQTAQQAFEGDRCAINLSGDINKDDVSRGNWLTSQSQLPFSNTIDIDLQLLGSETKALQNGTPVHIHAAAQHVTGRIALLEQTDLLPNKSGLVQLILNDSLNVVHGDRVIIRDQAAQRTLGGGQVLNPFAIRRGRIKDNNLSMLQALKSTSLETQIEALLDFSNDGYDKQQLKALFNQEEISDTSLPDQADDYQNRIFATSKIQNLKKQILVLAATDQYSKFTADNIKLKITHSRYSVDFALQQLTSESSLSFKDGSYQLASKVSTLKGPELALWNKVEPILAKDPLRPPVLHDLAKQVNLPVKAVEKLLASCIAYKVVVRPVKNRFFLPDAIQSLKQQAIVLASAKPNQQFTVIDFRDAVGLGRNLCIELLEHFDNTGFTKRLGDQRIIQDKNR